MVVIDLGCGARKLAGAIGVDARQLPGVDIIHDLNRRPYPLPDDYADEVRLSHILEHLADPVVVLEEVWRITRPGGRVHIRVPHYTGPYAWKDPTHVRCFTTQSFEYFGTNSYSYYTHARYDVRSVRLKYFLDPHHRRVFNLWGGVVQWILDRRPRFAERFLAYLVGGIDEIQVTLEAVKGPAPRDLPRGHHALETVDAH